MLTSTPQRCVTRDRSRWDRPPVIILVIALSGIAICGLFSGDFAYQWQPVPGNLPDRALLARIAAALLLALALGLGSSYRSVATRALTVYLALWAIGLHGPLLVAHPFSVAAWLGVAEIGSPAIAMGAIALPAERPDRQILVARSFGACALVFGIAHFVYPDITAGMVPRWIPGPLFWAYFTGLAHCLGGAAILCGLYRGYPAVALGCMYLSWAIVLHLPRVAANPASRMEWIMLFIAMMISAAAFLVSRPLRLSSPAVVQPRS